MNIQALQMWTDWTYTVKSNALSISSIYVLIKLNCLYYIVILTSDPTDMCWCVQDLILCEWDMCDDLLRETLFTWTLMSARTLWCWTTDVKASWEEVWRRMFKSVDLHPKDEETISEKNITHISQKWRWSWPLTALIQPLKSRSQNSQEVTWHDEDCSSTSQKITKHFNRFLEYVCF